VTWTDGKGVADWRCHHGGRAGLIEMLAGLERPAGVLGVDDIMAAAVIEACGFVGIGVPDEVAVVGFGNCEILCMTTAPPLSSIPFPAKEMGYHAARSLHLLMEGKGQEVPARRALPIVGIRVRESTVERQTGQPSSEYRRDQAGEVWGECRGGGQVG
jgi:DNA-binding LacI/PurR family transcriptional regulator